MLGTDEKASAHQSFLRCCAYPFLRAAALLIWQTLCGFGFTVSLDAVIYALQELLCGTLRMSGLGTGLLVLTQLVPTSFSIQYQ